LHACRSTLEDPTSISAAETLGEKIIANKNTVASVPKKVSKRDHVEEVFLVMMSGGYLWLDFRLMLSVKERAIGII